MKEDEIIKQLIELNKKTANTNHWLFSIYLLLLVLGVFIIVCFTA